jgi:hypothetical protein
MEHHYSSTKSDESVNIKEILYVLPLQELAVPVFTILLLLCLFIAPAAANGRAMGKGSEQVSDFAQYSVPEGWTSSAKTEQGDPQVVLTRNLHKITIRLAGGEGSRYKTAADFLFGFEARSPGGKLAERLGDAVVADQKTFLYRRQKIVSLPPPGEGGPTHLTPEEFCVVVVGERFFILSYSYGDSIPDPSYNGREVWREFLKSFELKNNK